MAADQESVVALLIERLDDPELTVRIHAGLQLGGMGVEARPGLPALLKLHQSADARNRRLAVMVLGSLGRDLAEVVQPLLDALQDEDAAVRCLADEALKEIAPTRERRKVA